MIELIAIAKNGEPETPVGPLPEFAREILEQTASLYAAEGYAKPWVGYLAREDGACIGFCAFKTPPEDGAVEIAYATMPGHEGKGVATRMAAAVIEIARDERPKITIRAQTLPEENASTAILKKLGFALVGDVTHPEDGLVWEWRLAN